jgi:hypothetical protein
VWRDDDRGVINALQSKSITKGGGDLPENSSEMWNGSAWFDCWAQLAP